MALSCFGGGSAKRKPPRQGSKLAHQEVPRGDLQRQGQYTIQDTSSAEQHITLPACQAHIEPSQGCKGSGWNNFLGCTFFYSSMHVVKEYWNCIQMRSMIAGHAATAGPSRSQVLPVGCKYFTYRELEEATNDWAQNNVIGDGGFGRVYKGRLQNGLLIAAKRLDRHGLQVRNPELHNFRRLVQLLL